MNSFVICNFSWNSVLILKLNSLTKLWLNSLWQQDSWGQHGAHLAPVGSRWTLCRPHEPCYLGYTCFLDSPCLQRRHPPLNVPIVSTALLLMTAPGASDVYKVTTQRKENAMVRKLEARRLENNLWWKPVIILIILLNSELQNPWWYVVAILQTNFVIIWKHQLTARQHCISCMPYPDSKVNGVNMGPTWVLSAPYGSNVGSMNLAIRVVAITHIHFPAVDTVAKRSMNMQGSHSSWKIIEIQICFKIIEKSLNFASVAHGKIIEFWNRHSFDWLYGK